MPLEMLPIPPSELGESPFWHPQEERLYWCDIAGKAVRAWHPTSRREWRWDMPSEPGCCAPAAGGTLVIGLRDGFYRLDTRSGALQGLAPLPAAAHDTRVLRLNDGRCDTEGRLWAGSVISPRTAPLAALWCLDAVGPVDPPTAHGAEHGPAAPSQLTPPHHAGSGSTPSTRGASSRQSAQPPAPVEGGSYRVRHMAGDNFTANGLAFSPDNRSLYWANTPEHRIDRFDFDATQGTVHNRRPWARFARQETAGAEPYGGRPDGAAVDAEGHYWVAMYEGACVLKLSPAGQVLQRVPVPVQCPTMVCFGGADLRTLYITSARTGRPVEEQNAPIPAGALFRTRVAVPGLPVNFFRLSAESIRN